MGIFPWFWSIFKISSSFFSSEKSVEIEFSDALDRKQTFHNNRKVNFVKSYKMGIFQRG